MREGVCRTRVAYLAVIVLKSENRKCFNYGLQLLTYKVYNMTNYFYRLKATVAWSIFNGLNLSFIVINKKPRNKLTTTSDLMQWIKISTQL